MWIVDIDLEKFFDNVPQDKLMSYVGRVIHDGDTESLIRKYLKAGVMNKGRYEATDIGTPQGGNLSPLPSNIMLNEFDKELADMLADKEYALKVLGIERGNAKPRKDIAKWSDVKENIEYMYDDKFYEIRRFSDVLQP